MSKGSLLHQEITMGKEKAQSYTEFLRVKKKKEKGSKVIASH